jgi:arylsulfatase A-like enzyme
MLRLVMFVLALGCAPRLAAADRPPNLVFILTDNQGAWTLGCYGNKDIRTPNLDRLAREGTLFERSYSSNAVCSPTRATYLTGLMPSQHGVHTYLAAGGAQIGPNAYCTIAEFRSLPKILKDAGYTCGLSGKWHLGGNVTPQLGFTDWTTTPHGHTTTFYDAEVIDTGKVRKEPTYLTDFWTDRAVRFIEANKSRPFFLFLAYNGPYGLGESLNHPARNRHAAYYATQDLPSFPREKPHPWLNANRQFLNNLGAMRRLASEVSGVDDGVGRVMETLKKHGLDETTLVVFTADQGLAAGHGGFWGMGDHTRPFTGYDWTTHVPLIWRHPGKVAAAQRSDVMVSNYDFLPSVLDYLGLKDRQAAEPPSPGRSYTAVVRGERVEWDNVTYFDFENVRSIRTDRWKLITRFPNGPDELYHLPSDPGERTNLIDRADHVDVIRELRGRMAVFFAGFVDPKYDLSRGGTSKASHLSRVQRNK